jgi:hypothetical protein
LLKRFSLSSAQYSFKFKTSLNKLSNFKKMS